MNNSLPPINPQKEVKKITTFIRNTFKKQKKQKAVIALSGGIDSTTSWYLLKEALDHKSILGLSMPYFNSNVGIIRDLEVDSQILTISIKEIVDLLIKTLDIPEDDLIRRGNIMARVRMTILYDYARKNNALVCGTENKSEHLLGYYTRFGDEASDLEPIRHFYKAQVIELAKFLNVPKAIVEAKPTAGLWDGQSDESEFGFTYEEADEVLYLYFDKKISLSEIKKMSFKNADKIIDLANTNSYKHKVPYSIEAE
jgi:NAD+ synthase